jgi:subtilisin family serine protease
VEGRPADQVDLSGTGSSKPYIIIPPQGIFKGSRLQLDELGVRVQGELPIIGGYTAHLTDRAVKKLEKAGYTVYLDEPDRFLPPAPWEKGGEEATELGTRAGEKAPEFKPRPPLDRPRFDTPLSQKYQGEGVTIAVVDTGIYPHPDFSYPRNRLVAFVDFVEGRTVPYDDNGHGTHVAGDAAGSGAQSGGLHRGTAPRASLVGVKVLNAQGSGRTSDILKGLEWCIQNRDRYNIRVINMSLGHPAQKKFEEDPIDQAVKKAWEAGIVVVAAAGNDGPARRTIKAPGDSPYALTVGAADDNNTPDPSDDRIADFSSRGPTPAGLKKPDLVAPGEAIMAPLSPASPSEAMARRLGLLHETLGWLSSLRPEELARVPEQQWVLMGLAPETIAKIKESPESARNEFNRLLAASARMPMLATSYVGMPGTSMATPIVAGVVAQMLEANPDLTPDQVKKILVETANPLPRYGPNSQGAGMVDPEEALERALSLARAQTAAPEPRATGERQAAPQPTSPAPEPTPPPEPAPPAPEPDPSAARPPAPPSEKA